VGTKNVVTKNELTLYPNPAENSFTIKLPNHQPEFLQIEIYDLTGRSVLISTNQHSDHPVNVENLITGIYFVKAFNGNGIFSGKLVIQ